MASQIHWSKDFVEHLRTVHFSLVILCVGLIIVADSQRDTVTRRAQTQLAQIIKVSEQISATQFDLYCKQQRNGSRTLVVPEPEGSVKIGLSQSLFLKTTIPQRPREEVLYRLEPECSLLDELPITPDNNVIQGARVEKTLYTTLSQESPKKDLTDILRRRPLKLSEFVAEWELLHHRLFIIIPTSLEAKMGGYSFQDDSRGLAKPDRPYTPYTHDQLAAIEPEQLAAAERLSGQRMQLLVAPFKPYSGNIINLGPSFSQNLFYYEGAGGYVRIKSFATVPLDGFFFLDNRLPESQRTNWKQGTFAEAFPELNTITKDRQDATFKAWDDALRDEINRQSDSFDAFGLKIPAQATTVWGTVLILGVQLYLLTHLIELTRKIAVADPGWEVAWIGIYQHKLARVLFVCSAIVLPPVAILVVSQKGVSLSKNTTILLETKAWIVMVGGVLISAIVAIITSQRLPSKNPSRRRRRETPPSTSN